MSDSLVRRIAAKLVGAFFIVMFGCLLMLGSLMTAMLLHTIFTYGASL